MKKNYTNTMKCKKHKNSHAETTLTFGLPLCRVFLLVCHYFVVVLGLSDR